MLLFSINGEEGNKLTEVKSWSEYKAKESAKRNILCASQMINASETLRKHSSDLLKLFE